MKNLGLALEAAGATFADIVKTTFVVNYRPEHRTIITDAKKPFWAGKPPTSALIGVAALALPEWLIEIEAVAVVDK
jgi:enamine deaminase RidA (YjgF/YER057c/UK114 family)